MPDTDNIIQKKISFATSDHIEGMVELLKDCRTQIMSVVDETEFKTVVNAVRLESEADFIQRLIIYLDKIRKGEINLHDTK